MKPHLTIYSKKLS